MKRILVSAATAALTTFAAFGETYYDGVNKLGEDTSDFVVSDTVTFAKTTMSCNCYSEATETNGNINADPQFVNAAEGRCTLLSSSPCIGTGALLNWTTADIDIDGNPRVSKGNKICMGCYEIEKKGFVLLVR